MSKSLTLLLTAAAWFVFNLLVGDSNFQLIGQVMFGASVLCSDHYFGKKPE